MSRAITETVLRLPFIPGPDDSHGNPTKTWGAPQSVGVYAHDPGSTSEPRRPGHDRVIVEPTVYGPFGMPFESQDLCIARGLVYEVEGEVRDWKHPNGPAKGSVVTLRRVDG